MFDSVITCSVYYWMNFTKNTVDKKYKLYKQF